MFLFRKMQTLNSVGEKSLLWSETRFPAVKEKALSRSARSTYLVAEIHYVPTLQTPWCLRDCAQESGKQAVTFVKGPRMGNAVWELRIGKHDSCFRK